MTVIDAHHHVWDLSVRDQDWITGPSMEPIRRSFSMDDLRSAIAAPAAASDASAVADAEVTATVLVQTVTVAAETPEMLALAAADPLIAGVVGWTDLTSADVAGALAGLRARAGGSFLVGIRHQVQSEPDPDWLGRPSVLRGLRAVADAGLCYDLVILPHQIRAAVRAADAVPGLTLVLDHAGKPPIARGDLGPWAADIRELAARPNTVCKLSGLVTEAAAGAPDSVFTPVADVVLEAFGPSRVMFGSDWPVCLLRRSYGSVLALARSLTSGLSAAERAAVFGGTAARTYGIGTAGIGVS